MKKAVLGLLLVTAACSSGDKGNEGAPQGSDAPSSSEATDAAAPTAAASVAIAQPQEKAPNARTETWKCGGSLGSFTIKISGFETSRMGGASVITVADGVFAGANPFGGAKKVTVEVRGNDGDIYDIDGNEFQKASGNPKEMAWFSPESGDPVECKMQ